MIDYLDKEIHYNKNRKIVLVDGSYNKKVTLQGKILNMYGKVEKLVFNDCEKNYHLYNSDINDYIVEDNVIYIELN